MPRKKADEDDRTTSAKLIKLFRERRALKDRLLYVHSDDYREFLLEDLKALDKEIKKEEEALT